MNHMAMLTFRGMSATWDIWEQTVVCTSTGWGPTVLEAALQRRPWRSYWIMSQQHAFATRRANSFFRSASGTTSCCLQVEGVISSPSSALERPHLKYWVQFWAPQYKQGTDLLEQIQRRAMKMMKGLKHVSDVKSLRELVLFNLARKSSGKFYACV